MTSQKCVQISEVSGTSAASMLHHEISPAASMLHHENYLYTSGAIM